MYREIPHPIRFIMRFLLSGFLLVLCIPLFWWNGGDSELSAKQSDYPTTYDQDIEVGAEQFFKYRHFLNGKRLGLVVNHTSLVHGVHLVDTLLKQGHSIQTIFAPEHGFRGDADAGETVANGIDTKTKIPIVSLYGKNKKPTAEQLKGIDLVIFDIQDVGARFYTYTSTMTYIMEACAEQNIPLLILDRPNPNGHYVDGPVLRPEFKSFVGLHPVPIVHGLTVAEYARMINGEGWLSNGVKCPLYHVECANYTHRKLYALPVAPSPNLPNMRSIYLYPSLCLFEGTDVSVGRGTDKQFQVYGSPNYPKSDFQFTPVPKPGAKQPLHEGKTCQGFDLTRISEDVLQGYTRLDLSYLLTFYRQLSGDARSQFFRKDNFLDLLAGTDALRLQVEQGKTQDEIRASWQPDLARYLEIRQRYLLYPDF